MKVTKESAKQNPEIATMRQKEKLTSTANNRMKAAIKSLNDKLKKQDRSRQE